MNATSLMKLILVSPDLKLRAALIGQLVVPLLALDEASRVEAFSGKITLSLSEGDSVGELVVEAHFTVADWTLVPRITREIANGRLRAEVGGVVDDTGDHDGLVILFNERTAMTVFASAESALRVRIGGFADSATIHDGCLMEISRDAASISVNVATSTDTRDRRRNSTAATEAREGRARRAEALTRIARSPSQSPPAIAMPRLVIRLIGNVGNAAASARVLQAVLYGDRGPRLGDDGLPLTGAAPIGILAERIKIGLGVSVLQASHALQNLGLTKKGADERIEEELRAGHRLGTGYLLGIGRANLAEWTSFNTEDELKRFSRVKYEHLPRRSRHLPMPDRASRVRAEVSAIKPLSMAYGRALTILKAYEKAIAMSSELARIEIRKAYEQRETEFSSGDLIVIAISADINPLPLWPKHNDARGDEFEILRFVGRLQRGADAVLLRVHFDAVRGALTAVPAARTLAQQVIAGILEGFFDLEQFTDGLDFVEANGDALVIARGTKDFAVGEAVGRPA